MLTILSSIASDNILNSVVLENTGNRYNIILRTDSVANVKKIATSKNSLTIDIKGVTSINNMSTLYKNTADSSSVILENLGQNGVKLHIKADNIANSNIFFEIPGSAPIVVTEKVSNHTVAWSVVAFVLLCTIFARCKSIKGNQNQVIADAIHKDMRDREIAMYKTYKKELLTIPSIDYKIKNPRLQQVIRRADTIRHLQRMPEKSKTKLSV